MIRAFIALDLDDASIARFASLSQSLREGAPRASWVDPAKMHLTLKFLGDIEEDEAAKLTEVLREIPLAPMRPRIRGVTAFPSPSRARVIVVALADPNVDALAAEVERRSGFPREERPFRAHVTLARIRQPVNAHRWLERATIEGETQVTALVLYESKQGAYRPISRFPAPTS